MKSLHPMQSYFLPRSFIGEDCILRSFWEGQDPPLRGVKIRIGCFQLHALYFSKRKAGVLSYVHTGGNAAARTDATCQFQRLVYTTMRPGQV